MAEPTFCCTCIKWNKIVPTEGSGLGICESIEVASKIVVEGRSTLCENYMIWTEPYFGCIHWRNNNGVLVSTDKYGKKIK